MPDKRILLMTQGAQVLLNWLEDVMNQGIAQLKTTNATYWENLASLMVDHKLGSIARRLRRFGSIIQEQELWFDTILSEIGQLYLIAKGLSQIDRHHPIVRAEILAQAGKSMTKKEILATSPTHQPILTMGHSFGQEEQLSFRKTWYWLEDDQRFAMELDFIVGRQNSFPNTLPIGLAQKASIFDYPSTLPYRVLVQNAQRYTQKITPKMLPNFSDMLQHFGIALGKNPWLVDFPCIIQSITPILRPNNIQLADQNGDTLEVNYHYGVANFLSLYAQKRPVHLFGAWDGREFQPISLVLNGLVKQIRLPKPARKQDDWGIF